MISRKRHEVPKRNGMETLHLVHRWIPKVIHTKGVATTGHSGERRGDHTVPPKIKCQKALDRTGIHESMNRVKLTNF